MRKTEIAASQLPHMLRRMQVLEAKVEAIMEQTAASGELTAEALRKMGLKVYYVQGKYIIYKERKPYQRRNKTAGASTSAAATKGRNTGRSFSKPTAAR